MERTCCRINRLEPSLPAAFGLILVGEVTETRSKPSTELAAFCREEFLLSCVLFAELCEVSTKPGVGGGLSKPLMAMLGFVLFLFPWVM